MNPATEQAYQQIIRQQQARIAELEKKVEELFLALTSPRARVGRTTAWSIGSRRSKIAG